ncbi:hypothetical protein PHLGIDRAFT_20006 [Phlebiopsis gigantea 11061_1 CR5-6]|uniref:Uncharacterized protein n=1 Tax=Phlebiopsis gigantea (strain 11061_1 CR5-6) TaxID=745531 RepID=A0A0C3S6T8_PHLG1|nr:hypothetical protein PHLGIDRAFT_20006 [Phlebiopsis gigantea 11061_1 CR5-6]
MGFRKQPAALEEGVYESTAGEFAPPITQTNHVMSISTANEDLTTTSASTHPVVFMITVSCPRESCEGDVSVPVMLNSVPFPPTSADVNKYEDVSWKRTKCPGCKLTVRVSATMTTVASIELEE